MYPGERPIVNGTVSGTNSGTWTGYNENTGVLGAIHRSYITWDGFTVQANNGAKMATVYIMGENGSADYCTIKNFIFNGGTQQVNDGNNWEGLRVEHVKGLTVSNCVFFNYRAAAESAQHVRAEVLPRRVWSHRELRDLQQHGRHLREERCRRLRVPQQLHPRLLHPVPDDARHGAGWSRTVGRSPNNVLVNASYMGFADDAEDSPALHGNDWVVANNTFYNAGWAFVAMGSQPGHGWKFYNNISSGSTYGFVTNGASATLAEVDHNQWGATFKLFLRYNVTNTIYTTLAAWQASTELEGGRHPGVGDLASDPGFSNGSGTLKLKSDFVLRADIPVPGRGKERGRHGRPQHRRSSRGRRAC